MAAGVPASHAIFLVVALIASASVGAAMLGAAFNLSDELEMNSEKLSDVMSSDIKIINDNKLVRYDGGVLYLHVLNTGDRTMRADDSAEWMVIVDGALIGQGSLNVRYNMSSTQSYLPPGQVADINVQCYLSAGDHSVKVMYGGLAEDRISFRIG